MSARKQSGPGARPPARPKPRGAQHSRSDGEARDVSPSARAVALDVLVRVLDDSAFATLALDSAMSRARLRPADRALATDIVLGTLRMFPVLDEKIGALLTRPAPTSDGLETAARCAAMAGLYQLAAHRSPPFAVTSETVEAVRRMRGAGAAGLVNALLRTALRGTAVADVARFVGKLCLPSDTSALLEKSVGAARLDAYVNQRETPKQTVRLRSSDGMSAGVLQRELSAHETHGGDTSRAAQVVPTAIAGAFAVEHGGNLRDLEVYRSGEIVTQDGGSQLLGALFVETARAAGSGELRVLDACAGHGGKTFFIADALRPKALVAADVHLRKSDAFAREAARLGYALGTQALRYELVDFSRGNAELGVFDAILVDAPCSGSGTLYRRPEIALRLDRDKVDEMVQLQRAILANVVQLLRPGGVLVYAVCSMLKQEILHPIAGATLWSGERLGRVVEQTRATWTASGAALELGVDADAVVRIGPWTGVEMPDAYQLCVYERSL